MSAKYLYLPHPLNPPLLQRRGGSTYRRGANAPLKHPVKLISFKEKGRGKGIGYHKISLYKPSLNTVF
jgi:hypothetical protein